MKTDLYIKTVLTLIAVLLFLNLIATGGFVTKAEATPPGNGYAYVPVNDDGSINVRVVQDAAPTEVILVGWKPGIYVNNNMLLSAVPICFPEPKSRTAALPVSDAN